MDTTEMIYKSSSWHVNAEALCDKCNQEHIVTGFTKEKRSIGKLKNDLVTILRDKHPDYKLQPKPIEAVKWDCFSYIENSKTRLVHKKDAAWGNY